MDKYLQEIINKLTLDDVILLGTLYENEATATHKAMKKKTIIEISSLTEAKYKKSLYRLMGSCLIDIVTGITEQRVYVTDYGFIAIQKHLEGVEG